MTYWYQCETILFRDIVLFRFDQPEKQYCSLCLWGWVCKINWRHILNQCLLLIFFRDCDKDFRSHTWLVFTGSHGNRWQIICAHDTHPLEYDAWYFYLYQVMMGPRYWLWIFSRPLLYVAIACQPDSCPDWIVPSSCYRWCCCWKRIFYSWKALIDLQKKSPITLRRLKSPAPPASKLIPSLFNAKKMRKGRRYCRVSSSHTYLIFDEWWWKVLRQRDRCAAARSKKWLLWKIYQKNQSNINTHTQKNQAYVHNKVRRLHNFSTDFFIFLQNFGPYNCYLIICRR